MKSIMTETPNDQKYFIIMGKCDKKEIRKNLGMMLSKTESL